MHKVGFVGLGVMGFPMSSHISSAGFTTYIYNRTANTSHQWLESNKGIITETPGELAEQVEILMLCVGRDEDVEEVVFGKNGIIEKIRPGTILVDHTTTSAKLSKKMNRIFEENECFYLDAPVSGGQAGAENAMLTVMIGGDQEAYKKSLNVINSYSKFINYMGPSGSGQLTKMVNQISIAGLLQALAEAVNFSEKAGLDSKNVLDVISKGAAQSWQMDNRWETMTKDEFDFGFAVDWMRKDLDIVLEEAKKIGANVELTELINNYYNELQESGGGRWDTSSLLKRIRNKV